jgi:hypothetical protein
MEGVSPSLKVAILGMDDGGGHCSSSIGGKGSIAAVLVRASSAIELEEDIPPEPDENSMPTREDSSCGFKITLSFPFGSSARDEFECKIASFITSGGLGCYSPPRR